MLSNITFLIFAELVECYNRELDTSNFDQ